MSFGRVAAGGQVVDVPHCVIQAFQQCIRHPLKNRGSIAETHGHDRPPV